jgi:subtilase family serine protease
LAGAQGPGDLRPVKPQALKQRYRPDLIIENAELVDSTAGTVKVIVKNKGGGFSGTFSLRLIVWEMGKFEQKSAKEVFTKISSAPAGKSKVVEITAGVPIISTQYSLFVDIGEDVAESNENNNRWEGEAGKS